MMPKPIKILLAEDDLDDQLLFTESLVKILIPTDLVIVSNGKEVIEYLTKADNFRPHIIFLDINMPFMNGLECLQKLREDQKHQSIPCVIFTTSSSPSFIEQSYQLGANLYIVKPSTYAKWEEMITKALYINWNSYFPPNRELYFLK